MGVADFKTYLAGTKSPEEKKLLRKLDFFILSFCCLMYFFNYLDRTNLALAYVSGMKEDLAFKSNELTLIGTVFTCGYVVGMIPCNLALYHIKPRIFFPAMVVAWALLTMVMAAASTPQHLMVIKFFQGVAESSTFVGTHYILGSWYTESELGKRSGIFTASGLAGTMIGGFIQTGIYSSLNGAHGLPGWKWLFIIDGIITLPVAIYGFFLFPDTPSKTTAPYLNATEKAMAIARVPHVPQQKTMSVSFIKRVLGSWFFYGFVILWIIAGLTEAFSTQSLLALYMKSQKQTKYTVIQLNNYPTGVPAVGIVSTLFWATLTDYIGGKRYLIGYWIGITGIATSAMILCAGTNVAQIFAAYYWHGSVYACQATFFAWANDAMRLEEDAHRAVVIASMNMGSNAVSAWWNIIFYSSNAGPKFTRGMWSMVGTCIALAIWTAVLQLQQARYKKQQSLVAADTQSREGDVQEFAVSASEKV